MIKLKTILLEASKASSATPSEYSGDNGNANKLSSTVVVWCSTNLSDSFSSTAVHFSENVLHNKASKKFSSSLSSSLNLSS